LGSSYYSYPGSPEGLGFDELGEHGVLVGQIGRRFCSMRFVPISQRNYYYIEVDVTGLSREDMVKEIKSCIRKQAGDAFEANLYRISLSGDVNENRIVSLDYISAALHDIFYFKLKDNTHVAVDKKAHTGDNSLRGLFLKKMLEKLEEHPDDESLQLAMKLGLRAFSGKVNCQT
jgi:hypothetical protein